MRRILFFLLPLAFAVPAGASSNRWVFTADGRDLDQRPVASLSFGNDEPEDPFFSLSCRPGSGGVQLHAWIDAATEKPARGSATLTSGTVRLVSAVQRQGEAMYGGTEVDGSFPARSPVFAAFARSGRLKVSVDGHPVSPTLSAARPSVAAKFIATCR